MANRKDKSAPPDELYVDGTIDHGRVMIFEQTAVPAHELQELQDAAEASDEEDWECVIFRLVPVMKLVKNKPVWVPIAE